jgi:hypothetical protein
MRLARPWRRDVGSVLPRPTPRKAGSRSRQVAFCDRTQLWYLGSIGVSGGLARGWACDPDWPNGWIRVHLYVGGPAGFGVFATEPRADQTSEAAVNKLCKGGKSLQKLANGRYHVYFYDKSTGQLASATAALR